MLRHLVRCLDIHKGKSSNTFSILTFRNKNIKIYLTKTITMSVINLCHMPTMTTLDLQWFSNV